MKVIKREEMNKLNRKGYYVLKAMHKEMRGESIGIYYTTVPKGGKVAMHFHIKAMEILIFLTKAKVKVSNYEFVINPQDIVLLDPKERHEIYGPSRLIAIRIPDIEGDKVVC